MKSCGNGSLDLVDEILQILLEDLSLARREFEGLRLVRILEVVDVTPIRRSGFGLGDFFQITPSRGPLSGYRRPCSEDVEPFALHLHAESQGFEGSVLTNDSFERG